MKESDVRPPLARQEAELPEGKIVRLLHNRESRKTIVEIQLPGMPPLHRVYWRRVNEQRYSNLLEMGPDQSLQDAVTCEAPFLFLRVLTWTRQGNGYGARTTDVLRADLRDTSSIGSLGVASLLPENAHVVGLLRANDAGTRLDLLVILNEPNEARRSKRARYTIHSLDLVGGTGIELDTLRGLSF